MKVVRGTIFLVLLFSIGAFAESDADKKNQSQTAQQKAENKESSFSKPVRAAASANPGGKNNHNFSTLYCNCKPNKEEGDWYDVMDKNRFLLFIAFLQLGVFVWQGRSLRQTVKAMTTSERPYIFAEVEGNLSPSTMEPGKTNCTCVCYITNRGKTPAIITMADCKLMRVGESNFNYRLRDDGQITAKGIALGINDKPLVFDRSTDLLSGTLNENLILYGKVEYNDIFGKAHVTEFEFIFMNNISRFCVSGNKERNRYT